MYDLDIKPEADKIFNKLKNRDRKQLQIIDNKIREIRANPFHIYKFLKDPLQTFNRIHIDKHFVIVFKINHTKRAIEVYYYDHHDKVYDWRPK